MSTVPYYKVCPECRTEHTHVSVRCADCDVELVHADALAPEPGPVELPSAATADITGDDVVDVNDLLAVLGEFGCSG